MIATITGATGHVGATLARTLLSRGYTVRAIVHRGGAWLDGMPVQKVDGDVGDEKSLLPAFDHADVVFHTAARISITRADTAAVNAVNFTGTRNVIAAFRKSGAKRLVHFSSIEALDAQPLDTPLDEERPFVPAQIGSPYALSKAAAETEVRAAMASGMDAIILNPTAIIGPFDVRPSLLGQAVISFAQGRIPALVEGGFDWVDVRDVAEAAVAAAERAPAGGRYIIGGRWASMKELAELVCAAAGSRVPRLMCPFPLAQAWAPVSTGFCRITGKPPLFTTYTLRVLRGNRSVNHEKATRDFGYAPRDLQRTVRETLLWFKESGKLS